MSKDSHGRPPPLALQDSTPSSSRSRTRHKHQKSHASSTRTRHKHQESLASQTGNVSADNGEGAVPQSGFSLRRQKSLIRPDRERIDPNHPYYHYYAHASELTDDRIANSQTGNTPRKKKSLTEKDRHRRKKEDEEIKKQKSKSNKLPSCWIIYCYIVTFYAPSFLLSTCGRMKRGEVQRAWREKIGLVSIILLFCGTVGFLTFGFTQAVCRPPPAFVKGGQAPPGTVVTNGFALNFDVLDFKHPDFQGIPAANPSYPPIDAGGKDASFLFQKANGKCEGLVTAASGGNYPQEEGFLGWYFPCVIVGQDSTRTPITKNFTIPSCHANVEIRSLFASMVKSFAAEVFYTWEEIADPGKNLAVYNGVVLDFNKLKWLDLTQVNVPETFITLMDPNNDYRGKDSSILFTTKGEKHVADCLVDIIRIGTIDSKTMGCLASDVVLWVSLIFIVGVVLIKFFLAVIFGWFISWRLGAFRPLSYDERMRRAAEIEQWSENILKPAPQLKKQRNSFLPATSRFSSSSTGMNIFSHGKLVKEYGSYSKRRSTNYLKTSSSKTSLTQIGTAKSSPSGSPQLLPVPSPNSSGPSSPNLSPSRSFTDLPPPELSLNKHGSTTSLGLPDRNSNTIQPFNFDLIHTICLVTAYSESVEGLRTTLDSLATTDYPNSHKVILVIADGIIRGSGNDLSTPDVCLSMMEDFAIPKDQVQAYSYLAIADGSKRHNMAKVYAGYYKYDKSTVDPSKHVSVPMVTIVKCGPPEEASAAKPGNRGKRDSQLVLMSFLQKVMFDERMTPLEYELFNSFWKVTGVTPDKYEIVLMVDADTKVYPDSLTRLVACMAHDPEIMGLCGETKIANKTDSFWTMMQVFEYYISHHSSKAFESIFGGVTCLPGCFCIYRIKAPKGPEGYCVPILANPDIVEHYSENIVDTLHKKNLLLLGEDRYLTTLMLRTFPKRKMMFVPQAVCKTIVPDTFSVLLSQRRRWINSTVHNLLELVLVRDLCGTFCFSMQFVIFMELVGTVVLPAAISFTLYLIVVSFVMKPVPIIPLLLLAAILGLPAILILMTTRKIVYVGWMLVYLLSLPIWNFVLPVYAYWHFDDFSWGQTRQIAGEKSGGGDDHGKKQGEFDSSRIVMKRWADFERERICREALAQGRAPPVFVEDSAKFRHNSAAVESTGNGDHSGRTPESLAQLTKGAGEIQRYGTPSNADNHMEYRSVSPRPGFIAGKESSPRIHKDDQSWKQAGTTAHVNDIELADMSTVTLSNTQSYQLDRVMSTPRHVPESGGIVQQPVQDNITKNVKIYQGSEHNVRQLSTSDGSVYEDFYNKSPNSQKSYNRRDIHGHEYPDSLKSARDSPKQLSQQSFHHQQEMVYDRTPASSPPLNEASGDIGAITPQRYYYNSYKQLHNDNGNGSSDSKEQA